MDTCKICGAPRDPVTTNCKFCGTAYTLEKVTGETYISALRQVLTRIDDEEGKKSWSQKDANEVATRKTTAISTFAMPSDLDSLLSFFSFCHGNAEVQGAGYAEEVQAAWRGKAKAAYTELMIRGSSEPAVSKIISMFASRYGPEAVQQKSGCFIATAAMGDYENPSVQTLSAFRDFVLLECRAGRRFVDSYYLASPIVADWMRERPFICSAVKWGLIVPLSEILKPVVRTVRKQKEKVRKYGRPN